MTNNPPGQTEDHPKIVELNDSVTLLEEKIKLLEENQIEKVTTAPNPQYQLLNEEILRTQLDIKRTERRIGGQSREVAQLEQYMLNIPTREDDLEKLQNELLLTNQNVEELTEKLRDAGLAAAIEKTGQGPSFELIDRPRIPTKAVFPNPIKFAALSLLLGLGIGALLIYLMTVFDKALRSLEEARQTLRMPVLGVVQRIEMEVSIQKPPRRPGDKPQHKLAAIEKAAL